MPDEIVPGNGGGARTGLSLIPAAHSRGGCRVPPGACDIRWGREIHRHCRAAVPPRRPRRGLPATLRRCRCPWRTDMVRRLLILGYGLVSYALFLVVFLYAIGFVGGFLTPTQLDGPREGSLAAGLAIDVGLLALFAVQHSGMARPG